MKPDIQEIKSKLYQKLQPSGWGDVLKTFLLSAEMDKILETLMEESEDGKKFTPKLKQVFRALEECPYEKLKVVMMIQDPYPYVREDGTTVADGIPMSVSNTRKLEASLKYVHEEIRKTVYSNGSYRGPMDLKVWSNQGVLMLNAALTTTVGRTGVHYMLWKPFMIYLLDYLTWHNGGLVYMYLGTKAKEYSKVTNENSYKLFASHPASAGYQRLEQWDSGGIFKRVNELLIKSGVGEIKW